MACSLHRMLQDVIPGISVRSLDLGAAEPRDADALPPSNAIELVGTYIYSCFSGFSGGNFQFALKAGMYNMNSCRRSGSHRLMIRDLVW